MPKPIIALRIEKAVLVKSCLLKLVVNIGGENKIVLVLYKLKQALEKNEDYVKLHTIAKEWQITFDDYDQSRQKQPTVKIFDICWGILNSRISEYADTPGLVRNQY